MPAPQVHIELFLKLSIALMRSFADPSSPVIQSLGIRCHTYTGNGHIELHLLQLTPFDHQRTSSLRIIRYMFSSYLFLGFTGSASADRT